MIYLVPLDPPKQDSPIPAILTAGFFILRDRWSRPRSRGPLGSMTAFRVWASSLNYLSGFSQAGDKSVAFDLYFEELDRGVVFYFMLDAERFCPDDIIAAVAFGSQRKSIRLSRIDTLDGDRVGHAVVHQQNGLGRAKFLISVPVYHYFMRFIDRHV